MLPISARGSCHWAAAPARAPLHFASLNGRHSNCPHTAIFIFSSFSAYSVIRVHQTLQSINTVFQFTYIYESYESHLYLDFQYTNHKRNTINLSNLNDHKNYNRLISFRLNLALFFQKSNFFGKSPQHDLPLPWEESTTAIFETKMFKRNKAEPIWE